MGERKEIKVRLSTVVYLFIILVLVVALGAVYYLGFVKNDNANNMIANGEVTETNNTEKEEINENKFKEGIYSFANIDRKDAMAQNNKFTPIALETYIKFENNDFKVYDNGQIFTSGKYEKISDNLIKCVISDERSFEIKIMGNNELEITKLNSNDAETEFNIRLYDILGEENEYVLYEESDLVGTWSTSYVYKDMGGGDFWKTEEHYIDETFTFNNDGTYKVKEYRAVAEGTYELEKNQIHISHDKSEDSKMYLIDKDTILYTLGTEYKIFLSKNS